MHRYRNLKLAAALLLIAAVATAPASSAACEEASPDPAVTSPSNAILGFPYRRARTNEINSFVQTVDNQSARVRAGTFGTSWKGTTLRYALVSSEKNIARVDQIAAAQQRLRDPRTISPADAQRVAATLPAIVWYTGNVHGNETSGADAALEILYRLAAGRDCEVEQILDNLIVGIIPTQNPDGRDGASRTNAYGFDMNRDWFAATQPETDGKLDLLSKYPPVLFIDAHEMASTDFFFPPNADPIHHEISPQSLHWINDLYAPAITAAFEAERANDPANWDYFNYDIYDLFYMGYGDTVPTTAFTAAGMTFEKGTADADGQREAEQFVAGWTSLLTAARHRAAILRDYSEAHRTALAEGGGGKLEPNVVIQPGNSVQRKVPNIGIRHYFIDPRTATTDANRLVSRLMRMGVEVYRLDRDLRVPDLRRMGRAPARAVVPRGSYWIPMAQPQKRWIQAMLGEDSYVPFAYFYDTTSWSQPLLMNLDAGSSGARLVPNATRVHEAPGGRVLNADGASYFWFQGSTGADVAAAVALARAGRNVVRTQPAGTFVVADVATGSMRQVAERFGVEVHGAAGTPPNGIPVRAPKIALYGPLTQVGAGQVLDESFGHMRWLLERAWDLPIDVVGGLEIATGALASRGYDVLIVPGVTTEELALARSQIRSWIESGGMYIGTARPGGTGGTPFAVASGFTTAQLAQPEGFQTPGSQMRVTVAGGSMLSLGASPFAYWYQLGEDRLEPSSTGRNVTMFPTTRPDFWVSGYADNPESLQGSAGLVEETLGSGRVILFSGEPNFRGFTDGTALFLANALAYPIGPATAAQDVASADAALAVAAAMRSAYPATGPGRPLQIQVAAEDASAARTVLSRYADTLSVAFARGSAWFSIANPLGITAEEHPFARRLLPALRAAGIDVRSAVL